ncbi:MAG: SHOCT domain-containing protein [Deltaproteobacteria bacterium]|nr:SHOCT domain-containing protein [Deltaproteobacteria bacterium]
MSIWNNLGVPPEFQDTMKRLLSGDFAHLTPAQKQARSEQLIQAAATAAAALAGAPLPFMELPVQMALLGALARLHGVPLKDRKAFTLVLSLLGGGAVLRRLLRVIPLVGPATQVGRVYAATWALGRVAVMVFSRPEGLPPEEARRVFQVTLERQEAQTSQLQAVEEMAQRFARLQTLRDQGVISEEEYTEKRKKLLEGV